MSHLRSRGRCPLCRCRVIPPEDLEGMWTGARRDGGPAGGGVHGTRCRVCRARLIAYSDVYDASGRICREPETEWDWTLRGCPWQTILLAISILALIYELLRRYTQANV